MATRDLLARHAENLGSDIKRKLETYLDIARESGQDVTNARASHDIAEKRLDRTEAEIMRLESNRATMSLKEDADTRKALDERIANLRQQQSELESSFKKNSERSPDLELRHDELEQLRQIRRELWVKLGD